VPPLQLVYTGWWHDEKVKIRRTLFLTAILATLATLALNAADFRVLETNPEAAGMNAALLARIPRRMQEFVDAGKASGYVTLVARHGHVAQVTAVGYRDLESKAPMRADAMFRIKSMTKPMTGVAVMILVEEGRLALVDPVEKYLPEFHGQKVKKPCAAGATETNCLGNARPITLFDVMTHTSGIQEGPVGARTLADSVAASAKLPLEFEPGSALRYSTAGINTAGRIVEAIARKPYEQFMAERIFTPLGMKDTTFFPTPAQAARMASVYTDQDGRLLRAAGDFPKFAEPGGGAFSTAADLALFYQAILSGGTLNGKRLLTPAAVQAMTSVQTGEFSIPFAPGLGYGIGWCVAKDARAMFRLGSVGAYGHGGAFRTYGWVDPAKDMVSVILLQRTNGGGDIADEINAFLAMSAAAIER
jgi:CubicO group peptidase (beta-lactamase class C family)